MKKSEAWQNRCPDEGQWMQFFDGEGFPTEREALGRHLRGCMMCQNLFQSIGDAVLFGDGALDMVHPVSMRKGPNASRYWISAAAVAVVILGVGAGFHHVGQKAMAAVGSLFQVQKIGTTSVTPEQLAALSNTVTQGGHFTLNHYGSVAVAGPMRQVSVPLKSLGSYGMPNLWPQSLGSLKTASVDTGIKVTLKLNVPHINQLIQSQGGREFFPQRLNGLPFTVFVPSAATMSYSAHHGSTWTVEEMPQPTIAVPGRVPVGTVMKALENLPFLPPSLQSAVARMANWKNTLIVPLPGHPENVPVAGTQGIVETNQSGTSAGEAWVQKGLVVLVMKHQATPINRAGFIAEVSRLFS